MGLNGNVKSAMMGQWRGQPGDSGVSPGVKYDRAMNTEKQSVAC